MFQDGFAERFAKDWIDAWNRHDLDSILSHYEPNFEFSSPVLAKFIPGSQGKLNGVDSARAYWAKAFTLRPDLHFEPIAVLKGVDSLVIHYKGLDNKLCAEFFIFGGNGKVVRSHAHGA